MFTTGVECQGGIRLDPVSAVVESPPSELLQEQVLVQIYGQRTTMTRHLLPVVGVCLLTFFAGLGAPALTDSDEAFYAESAREMVESGDWLTPHFNYTYRFEKPILYYWLAAATFQVAGVTVQAARFPSAVAGLGLVVIALMFGRRWYDASAGLLAALVTATSFGAMIAARQALPDLPLAFFISLSTWAAFEAWLDRPALADRERSLLHQRGWIALSSLAATGAFLTKGPIGLVLPAVVVGPILLVEHALGRSRWRVSVIDVVLIATIVTLGSVPWYAAMTMEHGLAYLERFFLAENLDRFATPRYNDPRPLWYYAPIVAGGLLPWSPFMALWLPKIRRAIRHRITPSTTSLSLAWWALAPLLFYTLSIGKQPRYILPVIVPLAVLLARAIRDHLEGDQPDLLFSICASGSAVALFVVGGLVIRASPLFPEWPSSLVTASGVTIALGGLGILVATPRRRLVPSALATSSVVVILVAHYVLLASPGDAPVERMAALVTREADSTSRTSRYRVFDRNLIFYSHVPFEELNVPEAVRGFLESPDPVLLVLPAGELARMAPPGVTVRTLGAVDYVNTGSFTMRMLMAPDQQRYVQRILLVTNR